MNEKHQLFAQEFLKDRNATQAAIRAGYSEKTAGSQGERLLKNAEIKKFIVAGSAERFETVKIDTNYILMQLGDMQQATIDQILNEDGSVKPPQEWPTVWQRMINGIEVKTTTNKDGTKTTSHKIKLIDRGKIIKMLGDHVDISAFVEKAGDNYIDNSINVVNLNDTDRAARIARMFRSAMVRHENGKAIEGEKK